MERTAPGASLETVLEDLFSVVFNTPEKCRLHICLMYEAIMGSEIIKKLFTDKSAGWHTMVDAGLLKAGFTRVDTIRQSVFVLLDTIILRRALDTLTISEKDMCAHISKFVRIE